MEPEVRVIEADVVVVGAGSAGAVIASRLSETIGRSVVLLEAGPDYCDADAPPEMASIGPLELLYGEVAKTYLYPDLTARLSSEQQHAHYRRGRGVGGSSSINGLFAVRPTVDDLDEWAASGCRGWSFADVLPYFKVMEEDFDFGAESYHGDSGPLPIRRPGASEQTPLDTAFSEASLALGHCWSPDHNAPKATGLSPYAYNARGGRRVSTNTAYLEPARARPNLTILGETVADRILWNGARAVGVAAVSGGESLEIRADEVVVCAGAIHSPALLLRSGIGPAADLRALDIEVIADLPVGEGLQEHPAVAVGLRLNEPRATEDRRHAGFCLRFDTGAGDEPDGGMATASATDDPAVGVVIGWVNRVDSTGRVRLNGRDPRRDPHVEFDMVSTPTDVRRMTRVVEELRSITGTTEFKGAGELLGLLTNPTRNTFMPIDEALAVADRGRLLREAVFDVSHVSGSCRMGDPSDPRTVVDPHGAVHGVANLRVADASVFPFVPRANTHLSAVLVGEKIADDFVGGASPAS